MRKLAVYQNGILAGVLIEESSSSYIFVYEDSYFLDTNLPAISLTLPKNQKVYQSKTMFPFFANMLAEGENLTIQVSHFKV